MPLPLPTFTNGAILTAVQLNQMVSAVNALKGVIEAPSVGYQQAAFGGDGWVANMIRHQTANRYLHVYYTFDAAAGYDLRVYINGTLVHTVTTPPAGLSKLVVDLNSLGLTPDTWYEASVSLRKGSATGVSVQLVMASDRSGVY